MMLNQHCWWCWWCWCWRRCWCWCWWCRDAEMKLQPLSGAIVQAPNHSWHLLCTNTQIHKYIPIHKNTNFYIYIYIDKFVRTFLWASNKNWNSSDSSIFTSYSTEVQPACAWLIFSPVFSRATWPQYGWYWEQLCWWSCILQPGDLNERKKTVSHVEMHFRLLVPSAANATYDKESANGYDSF